MVPNNINEFESNLLIYVYGNKKRRPRACRIHKSLSFTVTYDGIVLLDNDLCLWYNARESAESGGSIHLEINFSSKVYSKSLLKGS